MRYQLRGITQACRGQLFAIPPEQPVVIGRLQTADIRVDDVTVSRKHCTLRHSGNVLMVRDENSVNGSYVNGVKLAGGERQLQHRDILQVGKAALMVEEVADLEADAPIFVDSSVT
jgi:pSer/pThr/pTyr-binding forkhead associated (FHA) protein